MFPRGIRMGQDDTAWELHGHRCLLALHGYPKRNHRRRDAHNATPRHLEPQHRRLRQNSLNSHLPPRNHVSPLPSPQLRILKSDPNPP